MDTLASVIWIDPVEESPIFCGCENEIKLYQNQCTKASLNAFIINNLTYPEEAIACGFQGKLWVQFKVLKTGEVTDVEVLKGVHEIIDNAVINTVKKLHDFVPGTLRGKAVDMTITLPVNFRLR